MDKKDDLAGAIEVFKQIRDCSDDIVKALENKDNKAAEVAITNFYILMAQLDALR